MKSFNNSATSILRLTSLLFLVSSACACQVSSQGPVLSFGDIDDNVSNLEDHIYFNYQVEYEKLSPKTLAKMMKELKKAMVQKIVETTSIFPECSSGASSTSSATTGGISTSLIDTVTEKQCTGVSFQSNSDCAVMEGYMKLIFPESSQDDFVPKLQELNKEITDTISDGMGAYVFDSFVAIEGVKKLQFIKGLAFNNLPLKSNSQDVLHAGNAGDSLSNVAGDSASKPRGRSAGTHVGLTFMSLIIISSALFGTYYVVKRRRNRRSSELNGDNNAQSKISVI